MLLSKHEKYGSSFFLVFTAGSILAVVLRFYYPGSEFLFSSNEILGESIYALVTGFVFLIEFLLFTGLRIVKGLPRKSRPTLTLFSNEFSKVFGITFEWRYIILGSIAGVLAGIVTIFIAADTRGIVRGDISLLMLLVLLIRNVAIIPIVEETIYRGCFINRFVGVTGRDKKISWILAGIFSIIIFSQIHTAYPWEKAIGGAVFTVIYLYSRNLLASIAAHSTGNFLIILAHLK